MALLTIDISGKCNLGCEFCYQSLDGSELSLEEVTGFVRGSPDASVVEIGGGEPLLHNDLFDIMSMITEMGKRVHISTNGTVVPDGMLDLEESVRDSAVVQVSLHAGNPKLYNEITGKDLFNQVLENAAAFRERYNTVLSAAVYQRNFDSVPEILAVADGLGVPLRVNLVMPSGKGKDVDLISRTQLQELRTYLFEEKLGGKMIDSPLIHNNNCVTLGDAYGIAKLGECPFDCGKTYINPKGGMKGCEFVGGKI